jgi:hypothetical protein
MHVSFLLGVESLETALSALRTLPFVHVDGYRVTVPERMNLTVQHNIGDARGAFIVLGGDFTDDEIKMVERLGSYESDAMKDFVEKVLARFVEIAMEKGTSGTVRLLTRADASGTGSLSQLHIDTSGSGSKQA